MPEQTEKKKKKSSLEDKIEVIIKKVKSRIGI